MKLTIRNTDGRMGQNVKALEYTKTGGETVKTVKQVSPAPSTKETTQNEAKRARQEELDRLNRMALDPAINQNPTRMNQLNQQMKGIRAELGKQTVGDRVNDMAGAVFSSSAAGVSNFIGTAADTFGRASGIPGGPEDRMVAENQAAYYREMLKTGRMADGSPMTPETRHQMETLASRYEAQARAFARQEKSFDELHPTLSKVKTGTQRFADQAQADAARFTGQAKEGLGKVGQLAVDVGIAGGQMGLDALTAALTGGSSLVPMAVRAAGGAMQEARLAGADLDQQLRYGIGSAALSVGTEKIANIAGPFKKMFGAGAAEKIAGKLVGRFGENGAVKLMTDLSKTAGGRIALSALSEGGEEAVEDILQPFLKRATYDPDAKFNAAETGRDALIGAILGTLGAAPEGIGQASQNRAQRRAQAGAVVNESTGAGVDAAPAQNAVQSIQRGKNGPLETLNEPEPGKQGGFGAAPGTEAVNTQARTPAQRTAEDAAAPAQSGGMDPLMTAIFGGGKRVDQTALSNEDFGRLAELSEQGIVGMDAGGRVYQVDPAQHIDQRDWSSVGDRKVNAFQYDHPELKGYLQDAARTLIQDLSATQRADSYFIDGTAPGSYGYDPVLHRTKRSASPEVAGLLDSGISYDRIGKALDAIMNNHGAENYADAKRVELVLDRMLTDGFHGVDGWIDEGPNAEYIREKRRIAGSDAGRYVEDGTGLGAADAGSVNTDYDRLQAQNSEFHPEGPNAARPVDVPKYDFDGYNIPKSASTMMGAASLHDENVRQLEQIVADGFLSFGTIHDGDALAYASRTLKEKGFDAALEQYRNDAKSNVATKGNVALGQVLMRDAAATGNSDALAEIFQLYAVNSTTIAQAQQAQSMFRKLSPESQLTVVQKALNALNEKYGTDIQLDGEDAQAFLTAENQEQREAVRKQIIEKAAQAVPGTFKAQFDTWRYLAMLGNPRTHMRNVLGNFFFQPLVMAKNRVGALEEILLNSISDKQVERTKSGWGAMPWGKLAKEARADWTNAEEFLGRSSKYMDGQTSLWDIEKEADPFNGSGPVGRAVGTLAKWNGAALEAEDTFFKRWIYSQSLAGYLKSNGVKSISEADQGLLNRARNYAAQEALRNTFNDKNAFSDAVAKLGNARNSSNPFIKGGGYLVEGVLPFKRTPANVLARGVEYSPVGAVASMADLVYKGVTGKATAETVTKGLDRLAAGLSGSALLAAGFLLGGAGYITGGDGDDKKQKEFDDLTGHQNYALETKNGTSVTLDWLAPEAIPFFMGVELQRAMMDSGLSAEDAWNVVKNTSEPMLEMSMLQGLNDMFESASYAKNKGNSVIGSIAASAFTNYFTQAFPTLFGQLERTTENQRMTTYTDANSQLPKDTQYLLGKVSQKVPGWDYNQVPYIDAWGREEETGDPLMRAINNTLNPAYVSQVDVDNTEKELQRVKDATGDSGVFPQRAPRYFTINGERKDLTAKEYVKFAKKLGKERYDLVKEGMGLSAYKMMDNQEKASYIADLYAYADELAKYDTDSNYELSTVAKNAATAQKDIGVSPAEYLALYKKYGSSILSGAGYDKTKAAVKAGLTVEQYAELWESLDADGNGGVSQEEAKAALNAAGYPQEQKADLWAIINKSWKKNPYR